MIVKGKNMLYNTLIKADRWKWYVDGIGKTILISIGAIAIGVIIGIILALIMCAELGISMFLLKNKGLIIDNDNTIFIAGFVITALLTLWYIVPVMFNSSEHKLNNFKMKYAVLFGILTFLVSLILIYCVNTLMGFKLDNFEFFATKLIVPIVMVFNFVILPPIYGLLLKAKKFYD